MVYNDFSMHFLNKERVCKMSVLGKISLKVFIPIYLIIYYLLIILLKAKPFFSEISVSMFNVLGLIVAIICLCSAYKNTKSYKKYYWLLLTLSTISYTIGECMWFFHESILNLEIPIVSVIDVFYLLQYPFIIGGIMYLITKSNNKLAVIRVFFDTLIIIIIGTTMIFSLVHPNIKIPIEFDNPALFILIAYPLGDIALLFNIAYLSMLSRDVLPRDVVLVGGIGFLLKIVTDIVYLHNKMYGKPNLLYYEPLMVLALLFLALSGEIFLNKIENGEVVKKRERSMMVILLPYIIVLVIILIIFFKFLEMDILARGLIITTLLIILRQVLTIIENQGLVKLLTASNNELMQKKQELEDANSELRRFYKQKELESKTDFLTGLYNRRYIDEEFKENLMDCKVVKGKTSVLMVDIDHFKDINDTYGHDIGDVVLKNLSNIMKANIRGDDILIRFGGEEFICFLPNTNIDTANIIAERLRREVENFKFKVKDIDIKITVSIGISEIDVIEDNSDISSIIIKADEALYKAKRSGRNKVMHIH